jgi:hypothetical protein
MGVVMLVQPFGNGTERGRRDFFFRSRGVIFVNGRVFRLASLAACAGVCLHHRGNRAFQIEFVVSGGWAFRSRIVILRVS